MVARDLSLANQIARTTLADVVAFRLLAAAVAADPKNAPTLIAAVAADMKAAAAAYEKAAKATRDPKLHRLAEALRPMFDAMIEEIEALKPKA